MRQFSNIFYLLILMIYFTNCVDGNVSKLRTQIHLAEIDCPINLGMAGDLVSIKYNEKDNIVLLYYSINEEYSGPALFKSNKEMLIKQFRLSLSNEESKELISDIVNAHASLTAIYKSSSTGKTRVLSLPFEELKVIKDSPLSKQEVNELRISTIIDIQNSACPVIEEEGIVRTKVELVDNNIVIYYELDENLYDIKSMRINKKELWGILYEGIKDSHNDPSFKRDMNLMISSGVGYYYRYYGNKSKDFFDIVFTPDDLEMAMY